MNSVASSYLRRHRVFRKRSLAALLPSTEFFNMLAPIVFVENAISVVDNDGDQQNIMLCDLIESPFRVDTEFGHTIVSSDDGYSAKVILPDRSIETVVANDKESLRHALLTEVMPPQKERIEKIDTDGYVTVRDSQHGTTMLWFDRDLGRYYQFRHGVRLFSFDWIMNEENSLNTSILDCITLCKKGALVCWNTHSVPAGRAIELRGPNQIEVLRAPQSNELQVWEQGLLVATAIYDPAAFRDSEGVWHGGWAVAYGDGISHPGFRGRNFFVFLAAIATCIAIGSMIYIPEVVPIMAGCVALIGCWRFFR